MVRHEQLLIDALAARVGPGNLAVRGQHGLCMHDMQQVFRGGSMDWLGLERQMHAFRAAQIIIGAATAMLSRISALLQAHTGPA